MKAFSGPLLVSEKRCPWEKKQTFDFERIIIKIRKEKRVNKDSFALLIETMVVKLSALKPGQEAVIKEFESDEIFLKLMEMGCVPGESIYVEQVAPLGDPISILVAGYHLSLRINEADTILVETNN